MTMHPFMIRHSAPFDEEFFDQTVWEGETRRRARRPSGRRPASRPRRTYSKPRLRRSRLVRRKRSLPRGRRPAQHRRRPRWKRRPRRPIVLPAPRLPAPKGSEIVRWVQSTLNMVMNLRLPVSGFMGPETRSAIRDFQRREGLAVDGILGPDTKKALITARRQLSTTSADGPANAAADGQPPSPPDGQPGQEGEEQFIRSAWNWLTSSKMQVNRNSPGYIRWVQQSLNKIMGLRLAVDGINGPKTRSAIRDFQRKNGLTADGIAGYNTERALIAAGAGRPPLAATTPRAPQTGTQPAGSGGSLRKRIVQLANQEWQRWQQGGIKESDLRLRQVLEDYWRKGAGWLPNDPAWWTNYPWSAAFISWIMRQAGAGNNFKYSAAHAVYTKAAKDNRLAGNRNPFKAYRISEVAPQPGDIVCKSRAGSGATYDNIREGMQTHCDIVTAVQPGRLTTIGGNVSDSVKMTPVSIDGNGKITKPGYFAVIKVGASSP